MPGTIEPGPWYDVKIELMGSTVKCYLDGTLVQQAEVPLPKREGVFASATRDEKAGAVILKLVNARPQAHDFTVRLQGVKAVRPGARAWLLAADLPDANSLDGPEKVAPRTVMPGIQSPDFVQKMPANAFMVIQVPVE